MVDVAAIFSEVFGTDEQTKGSSENRCVRCVGVCEDGKPLKSQENLNTPAADKNTPSNQGVCEADARCVRDIVENQEVVGGHTPTHPTHRKMDTPSKPAEPAPETTATEPNVVPDSDVFEERTAIIHEAHTCTLADDGKPLPEPTFTLTQEQAETLAAQEQGYDDAGSLHGELVERWATEIERLAKLPVVSPDGAEALKRAQAFIRDGWALQAVRLGWGEVELFGVCPVAPWQRLDRKGAAFGGAVQAITAEAVVYVGGLRRYRAIVNNDGGAVPIWDLTQDSPANGGDAA